MTEIKSFNLRAPAQLLARLEAKASEARRSKTQEILVAIEAHLRRGEQRDAAEAAGAQTAGFASQA